MVSVLIGGHPQSAHNLIIDLRLHADHMPLLAVVRGEFSELCQFLFAVAKFDRGIREPSPRELIEFQLVDRDGY